MFKISISEKFFNSDLPLDPDFPYNLDQMKQAIQNLQKSFPTAAKQTSLMYPECNSHQFHDWFPCTNRMLWVGDILLQDRLFFFLPLWFLKLKGELWRKCKTYNIPIWRPTLFSFCGYLLLMKGVQNFLLWNFLVSQYSVRARILHMHPGTGVRE